MCIHIYIYICVLQHDWFAGPEVEALALEIVWEYVELLKLVT